MSDRPGVGACPGDGLGDDHTGGGSRVADGESIGGDVSVRAPKPDDGGRLVGSPVDGSIGDVVPNGCGVAKDDGVPLDDCGPTVDGDVDGGRTGVRVAPVWASAGAAASTTTVSASARGLIAATPTAPASCAGR